jgi:hypothetical protein
MHGDYNAYSVTDTATGYVSWANTLTNSWTPAFAFSVSGSVTYSAQGGKWYRTSTGGARGRIAITLSGVSSPSGNVTITGFPKNCTVTSANLALQTSSGLSTVTQPVYLNFLGGNSATIQVMVPNGSGSWTPLTGANLSASTSLIGDVECLQVQ